MIFLMISKNKVNDNIDQLNKRLNKLENEIKQLKKHKGMDEPINYKDYYFKDKTKKIKLLQKTLDQSGIILEIKTHNLLNKKGYLSNAYFYKNNQGEQRQIDIVASKEIKFDYNGISIIFRVNIVGDCKYRYQIDALLFPIEKKWCDLPLEINNDLIPMLFDFDELEKIPFSNKVTQLVIGKIVKDKQHLSDSEIFNGAKQVYEAIDSLGEELYLNHIKRVKRLLENHRSDLLYSFCRKLALRKSIINLDVKKAFYNYIDEYSKQWNNLLNGDIDYLIFQCIIPVLIFDANRGVLEAKLDDNQNLIGITDIDFGLFDFEKNIEKHKKFYKSSNQIVLCNLQGFEKFLKYLDKYLKNYEKYFKDILLRFPKIAICDFYDIINIEYISQCVNKIKNKDL